MWTSDRGRTCPVEEPTADLGTVTLGGKSAGVYLEGERRWSTVYSPGGYSWCPAQGNQVLVLKAGNERESPCIVGQKQESDLEPGEVSISSGTGRATVHLSNSGELALSGNVKVNGVTLETMIRRTLMDILG